MFPIEANAEKPRLRSAAFSSSASPSAPLCEEKPIRPGECARREGRVQAAPGTAIPRQFGPTSLRAVRADEREQPLLARAPSGPFSANPAEMTQSARTPRPSAAEAASITCSAGRQITARSTWSGISATAA